MIRTFKCVVEYMKYRLRNQDSVLYRKEYVEMNFMKQRVDGYTRHSKYVMGAPPENALIYDHVER